MQKFTFHILVTALCLGLASQALAAGDDARQYRALLENREVQVAVFHVTVPDSAIEGKNLSNKQMVELILTFVKSRYMQGQNAQAENNKKLADYYFGNISHVVIDSCWPDRIFRNNHGKIIGFRSFEKEGKESGLSKTEKTAPSDSQWQEKPKRFVRELFSMYRSGKPYSDVEKYLVTNVFTIAAGSENMPAVVVQE